MIDTLAATAVVGIGMVGVFSMLVVAQQNYLLSKSRLTGVMLAQEGVEWVRNIRDANVANGNPWNTNLGEGTYLVDGGLLYAVDPSEASNDPINVSDAQLDLTAANRMTHFTGTTPTRWYRIITLAERDEDGDAVADGLTVQSWVQWKAGGRVQNHVITTFLYDWQ